MERFSTIFLVAGLLFFGFSFIVMGVIPYVHFVNLPLETTEELAAPALAAFKDLERREPEAFQRAFPGGSTLENCATAIDEGKAIYVAEGCWHCHSQFIRPVSNENRRWGKISAPAEYQNELQLPPLLGTRRVGPDLIREAGVRSNDWHLAHFFNPRFVSPTSVMPAFSWFFEARPASEATGPAADGETGEGDRAGEGENAGEAGGAGGARVRYVPNRRGFAIVTYVQWLGSWVEKESRLD